MALSGDYVYIATGETGLRIFNVTEPTAPVEVDFYDTPGFAQGVAVVGEYAYIATGDAGVIILRLPSYY